MVRFILRHTLADAMCGTSSSGLFTILIDCPEVEAQLTRGGRGEYGWEAVEIVGAEVVRDESAKEPVR